MNNFDVQSLLFETRKDLSRVLVLVRRNGSTSDISNYLNKYAIIKACGTIEVAYKSIIPDYFLNMGIPSQIEMYLEKNIRENSSNPNFDNIVKYLKSFDVSWHQKFKEEINLLPNKNEILDSLSSLVTLRNQFSHGGSPNTTIHDSIKYYIHSSKIIEILDKVVV